MQFGENVWFMFQNRLARLAYKSCWKKNRFFCESPVIFSEDEEVSGENSESQIWQLTQLERDFSAADSAGGRKGKKSFQLWTGGTLSQTDASFADQAAAVRVRELTTGKQHSERAYSHHLQLRLKGCESVRALGTKEERTCARTTRPQWRSGKLRNGELVAAAIAVRDNASDSAEEACWAAPFCVVAARCRGARARRLQRRVHRMDVATNPRPDEVRPTSARPLGSGRLSILHRTCPLNSYHLT